jgi:hypothetical protein
MKSPVLYYLFNVTEIYVLFTQIVTDSQYRERLLPYTALTNT